MARIIVITFMFDVLDKHGYSTGRQELLASHGVNEDTGDQVALSGEHPSRLGAVFDQELREWVISQDPHCN